MSYPPHYEDFQEDDLDDDEACGRCHGNGGWHDCGEDSCCCLDPEEITHWCPECKGSGEVTHKRGAS